MTSILRKNCEDVDGNILTSQGFNGKSSGLKITFSVFKNTTINKPQTLSKHNKQGN